MGTPNGPHRAVCVITSFVTSSWNLWCSRDAGISTDDTQCTVGAETVIKCWDYVPTMAVAKGMLHNPNQYTDLLMTH